MIVGRDPERAGRRRRRPGGGRNRWRRTSPTAWWRRCSGALVAGLPGILAYKAINTLTAWSATAASATAPSAGPARAATTSLNLAPARLTGALLCLAGWQQPAAAGGAMLRDARRHRSPNAGWPEAAMAAALGLRLAGPRVYGGVMVDDAWMGDGRARSDPGRHQAGGGAGLAGLVAARSPPWRRRPCSPGLARDRQQAVEVQAALEMDGQAVQRRLDAAPRRPAVAGRGRGSGQQSAAEAVRGEQPVQVAAHARGRPRSPHRRCRRRAAASAGPGPARRCGPCGSRSRAPARRCRARAPRAGQGLDRIRGRCRPPAGPGRPTAPAAPSSPSGSAMLRPSIW